MAWQLEYFYQGQKQSADGPGRIVSGLTQNKNNVKKIVSVILSSFMLVASSNMGLAATDDQSNSNPPKQVTAKVVKLSTSLEPRFFEFGKTATLSFYDQDDTLVYSVLLFKNCKKTKKLLEHLHHSDFLMQHNSTYYFRMKKKE